MIFRKQKNGIRETDRVFAVTSDHDHMEDIRVALAKRGGWIENTEADCGWNFDLRLTIKGSDPLSSPFEHKLLRKDQIVNHFANSMNALCTKVWSRPYSTSRC